MSKFSPVGRRLYTAFGAIFFVNMIVLALAARVNQFQEFFFVADLFPLALSIITLVSLFFMMLLDFALPNAPTSRPFFTLGLFTILSIFWLAFNSFSTSRWRHVPLACSSIPAGFDDEKIWCRDLQALKYFVWIEWVLFLCTTAFTARYVLMQPRDIWRMALSRYAPHRSSEFLQFEKADGGALRW